MKQAKGPALAELPFYRRERDKTQAEQTSEGKAPHMQGKCRGQNQMKERGRDSHMGFNKR